MKDPREAIVERAAKEVKSNMYVNLGIGIPTLVAQALSNTIKNVFFQSENGLLGMGENPASEDEVCADLINAGKETITIVKGGSIFDSAHSFGMIRGGHIDLTFLGGMEVSQNGDLANYMIPKKLVKGMGGAMDLVHGAKKVIVLMEHTNKKGESKVKKVCNLPLTGVQVVHLLITELGVFSFKEGIMSLIELQNGVTLDEIKQKTEAEFKIAI